MLMVRCHAFCPFFYVFEFDVIPAMKYDILCALCFLAAIVSTAVTTYLHFLNRKHNCIFINVIYFDLAGRPVVLSVQVSLALHTQHVHVCFNIDLL